MGTDKDNPAGSPGQPDEQIESLESTELEAVDLETVSGGVNLRVGGNISPPTA